MRLSRGDFPSSCSWQRRASRCLRFMFSSWQVGISQMIMLQNWAFGCIVFNLAVLNSPWFPCELNGKYFYWKHYTSFIFLSVSLPIFSFFGSFHLSEENNWEKPSTWCMFAQLGNVLLYKNKNAERSNKDNKEKSWSTSSENASLMKITTILAQNNYGNYSNFHFHS